MLLEWIKDKRKQCLTEILNEKKVSTFKNKFFKIFG